MIGFKISNFENSFFRFFLAGSSVSPASVLFSLPQTEKL
jgi:hypothetical protein